MNYKEPTQEQLKLMQDFSNKCSEVMEIIMKCEPDVMLHNASARAQEAMMWFHSYVINGGQVAKESTVN